MELDSKDSEIEQLQMKLASLNSETASLSSKELGVKDLLTKQVNDLNLKEYALSSCKERENEYKKHNDQFLKENDELNRHLKQVQEELNKQIDCSEEVEKLNSKLKTESLLKQQAVNKLHEVLNRKEKNLKRLQQEFTQEKEQFVQVSTIWKKYIQDLQTQLTEESVAKQSLRMELDSKDSDIEQLQIKLASLNSETASLSSADNEGDDFNSDTMFEGWLSIPTKHNIRKHGWRKQYVVVSSRKIVFYNSESDKQNTDPVIVLDLCKVFNVRSVTHGDVIRADSKDIPRIFKILYVGEGEMRKTDEQGNTFDVSSIKGEGKPGAAMHKGHEFFQISYHMPTTCEVCPKPMWHMFRPPPALECRRCRTKIHKEHLDRKEDYLVPCKLRYDANNAKEVLLLAPSVDDQKHWVCRLSKKIQKFGYIANNSNAVDS